MTEQQAGEMERAAAQADAAAPANEALQAELEKAKAEAAEYLDQWRRSVADLSNARKRMQREQAELNYNATARVMARLLPVMDDIDRAIAALPAGQTGSDWANGFRMIQQKLHALLENEGVMPIATADQTFDPALHEAVSYEEYPGASEGQIIGEVARGYRLGERVLKPSSVRVAKNSTTG
jgi:molecular chaperone GrpE